MANQWFKFYGGEYLADPKMLSLSAEERSCWITLLCYASLTDGVIKYLSEYNLMIQSGLQTTDDNWQTTEGVLKKFEKMAMITLDNEVITITNWKKRQEINLTGYERVKRWREKKRNDNDDNKNDNGRIEENRIDKNREEESKSNSAFKKTKRFYQGREMRFAQGKWWVIPKDGGEWLSFAGKLSETEVK